MFCKKTGLLGMKAAWKTSQKIYFFWQGKASSKNVNKVFHKDTLYAVKIHTLSRKAALRFISHFITKYEPFHPPFVILCNEKRQTREVYTLDRSLLERRIICKQFAMNVIVDGWETESIIRGAADKTRS